MVTSRKDAEKITKFCEADGFIHLIFSVDSIFRAVSGVDINESQEQSDVLSRLAVQNTIFEQSCFDLGVTIFPSPVDDLHSGHVHTPLAGHATNQDLEQRLAQHCSPATSALREIRSCLLNIKREISIASLGGQKHKSLDVSSDSDGEESIYVTYNNKTDSSNYLDRLSENNDLFRLFIRQTLKEESTATLTYNDKFSTYHPQAPVVQPTRQWDVFEDLCETIMQGYSCDRRSRHIFTTSSSVRQDFRFIRLAPDENALCQLVICDSISQSQHQYVVKLRYHAPIAESALEDVAEDARFLKNGSECIEGRLNSCNSYQHYNEQYHCGHKHQTQRPHASQREASSKSKSQEIRHWPRLIFQTLKRFPIGNRNRLKEKIVLRSRKTLRIFDLEPVRLPLGVFHDTKSHCLDDVLARSKARQKSLPTRSRFALAVMLARSVLRLRKTSWLHKEWGSKDIKFHGPIPNNGFYNPSELFLRSQPQFCKDSAEQSHSPLFLLGVILLELAFSAPLRMLEIGENVACCYSQRERDYLNLTRLSGNVSRGLGSRYAKVVHQCLSEVKSPQQLHSPRQVEIKTETYHHVANELEGCLLEITS